LTITTLGTEALPLIRYKTGDLCTLYEEPCICGKTSTRRSPLIGRTKQRIKYKGTSFYPSAIFEILHKFDVIKDYLIVIKKDNYGADAISIHIAMENELLLPKIKEPIRTTVRILPNIKTHDSLLLVRQVYNVSHKRKLTKVIDLRL